MRFSKRVASVALAGVLACSFGAPAAFASSTGLLEGISGTTASDVAADAVSYTTHVYSGVALQMPSDWDVVEEISDAEAGATVETEDSMMQIMSVAEGGGAEAGLVEEVTAEFQSMMENYAEVSNELYYIDGVSVQTIVCTGEYEGVNLQGFTTFVFGDDVTFVMMTMQFEGENGFDPAFARVHNTVGLVPAGAGTAAPAVDSEPATEVVAEPETEPTTDAEAAPTTSASEGSFACNGWTITVGGDPVLGTIDNEWSDYNGMQYVGVPVTIVNGSGETEDPYFGFDVTAYGCTGVEVASPGYDFDDSIQSLGSMRPNATASCYVYALYNGDGEYTFQFSSWEDESNNFATVMVGEAAPAVEVPTGGFMCDGWTVIAGEGYVLGIDEDEWSDCYGAEVVGVPVTFVNNSGEANAPYWDLWTVFYGAQGVQVDSLGHDFQDSFENCGSMLPGAVASCYLYLPYEGDGEYVVAFEGWEDDSYDEIVVNVAK